MNPWRLLAVLLTIGLILFLAYWRRYATRRQWWTSVSCAVLGGAIVWVAVRLGIL